MNGPKTALAIWQTQYRLTMATNFGTTSPVVGIYWYNAGSTVTISASAPSLVYSAAEEQYVWNGWTGSGIGSYSGNSASPTITMNGPVIETASWTRQFSLTVISGYGTTGAAGWYNAGSNAQATVTPLTVAGATGTRYVFAGWTDDASGSGSPSNNILMNGPKTATATWTTQYLLTVNNGGHGVGSGSGYFNAGFSPTFSISPTTVAGAPGVQYVFAAWSGDSTSSSASSSILMNSPKTVTATWTTQYKVTVVSAHGSPDPIAGDHWVIEGDPFSVSVTSPDGDSSHQFVVNGPATQNIPAVYATQTLTFTWTEQWYITVNANGHGNPTGGFAVG